MNAVKPNDVQSAIMPLYYVSRLLGLASYRYEKQTTKSSVSGRSTTDDNYHSERQFRTSKCGIIYTATILLALLAWLAYLLILKILYDFSDVKLTYVVTQIMTLCLSTATTVISLVLELTLNRKRIEKVLNKFTQVDKILKLEPSCIYKKIQCFVILELLISLILLGARHGYELWSRCGKEYIGVIMRFIVHFMSTVMIVQFVSFIHVLKQRYSCVNKYLAILGDIDDKFSNLEQGKMNFFEHRLRISSSNSATIVPHVEDTPISDARGHISSNNSVFISDSEVVQLPSNTSLKFRSEPVPNMHTLRYVHTLLYDIGILINSVYGIQILLAMAYIFMSVVKYFHVVMISNVSSDHEDINTFKVNGVLALMCVVSIHIANLLWVTTASNFACSEAQRTAVLVNKLLLIQPLAALATTELQLFSQQLLHSKLRFTAFGFFNLDFTFLYGFVGGATTYIVILLQFQ